MSLTMTNKHSTAMVSILEKIHFENPTDIDVVRLQEFIEDNGLMPADIKYRFSKLYNWRVTLTDGKLALGYTVRFKRPNIAPSFTCNRMIVFESIDRFILQDKNGEMHGPGINEQEPQDVYNVEYRKWASAKKIADFMGLTYLGDGVFEKVEKSE